MKRRGRTRAIIISVVVFVAISTAFGLYQVVSENHEKDIIRLKTLLSADMMTSRMQEYLDERTQYLLVIRDNFHQGHISTQKDFTQHVREVKKILGGFQAINWIDTKGVIRWVCPLEGNEEAKDKNLRDYSITGTTLLHVDESGEDAVTPPIELLQGGRGFAMYFPIDDKGLVGGYLNGVFRLGHLLDNSIDRLIKSHYYYSIDDGDQNIASFKSEGGLQEDDYQFREQSTQPVVVLNRRWQVSLAPRPEFLRSMRTPVNEWITVLGILLASVAGLVVYRFIINKELILSRKEELEAVYQAYPDLQFRVRMDGTILDYHTSQTTDLFITPDQFLGRRMQDVLPPAVGVLFKNAFSRMAKGESNDSIDYSLNLENGPEYYEARVIPVSDDELIVIARNITPRKQLEDSLQGLAEGVSSAVDDSFFESMVHHLTIATGVDYAFVGSLETLPDGSQWISTLASCKCGVIIDNMEYDLADTPCEKVILDGLCVQEKGASIEFPNDQILVEMGAEGYAGMPLVDSTGTTMGVLVMLHTAALPNPKYLCQLLRVFAIRCAGELERQRDEKELRQSTDRLRTVIDNLPGIAYSYVRNPDGTKSDTYFSPGMKRLLGPKNGDLALWDDTEGYLEIMHPADRRRLEEKRNGSLPLSVPMRFDFRVRRDDDSYCWLRSLATPCKLHDGGVQWHGIILDIDKEKRTELELAQERQLFVGGPVVVFRWTAEPGWPVEYVTPNVKEVFGYSAQDFMSRRISYSEIIHPEDFDRVALGVRVISLAGKDSFGEIYRIIRPDGSVRSLYDYTFAERDENGFVTHYAGYVFDITEQQQAQEALVQSERRYRTVVEQSPIPIILHKDNIIIFANKAATQCVAGSSTNDLIGKSIWSLLHPDDHDIVRTSIQLLKHGSIEMAESIEERFVRFDGTVIDVEVTGSQIIFDNEPALQIAFQDITKRRQTDRLMSVQNETLASVAIGKPRAEIFRDLCLSIERGMFGSFSTIMLLDRKSGYLNLVAAPSISDEASRVYQQIEPGLASGSCGAAAHTAKAVYAMDVFKDDRWSPELCEVAKMVGIRSCWSQPIFSEKGVVLGTLAISHDKIHVPDEFDKRLLETAASLAGIVLQRDITTKSLIESEERYRTLVENAPEAIVVFDADTAQFIDMNENACTLFKDKRDNLIGKTPWEFSPDNQANSQLTTELSEKYINEALAGGTPVFEWMHCDREGRIFPCEVRLVRLPSSTKRLVRGSIIDISERKEAERRQQFMMDELDHRVKNNLASVLALARQTVSSTTSLEEFSSVFSGRIEALALAHGALASSKWSGVGIRNMLRTIINPQFLATPGKISYEGDAFVLSARSSGPVAMTLHELMTNSLKHGSLSSTNGRLTVSWHVEDDSKLKLTWKESDGQTVSYPAKTGLGLKLVRGFIEYELNGTVDLDFATTGLICRLTIPITEDDHHEEHELVSSARL